MRVNIDGKVMQNKQEITEQQLYCQSDSDISLLDLWKILMYYKRVIVFFTFIATIVALIYVNVATPIYKAQAFLLPPSISDIQNLNIRRVQNISHAQSISTSQIQEKDFLYQVSVKSVYELFRQNLHSRSFQKDFFDTYLDESEEWRDIVFVVELDRKVKKLMSLSLEWYDKKRVVEIVNQYVDFVSKKTIQQLWYNSTQAVLANIRSTEIEIAAKLKVAKLRKDDKIAKLSENLSIALEIEKQVDQSPNSYKKQSVALQVELDILRKRKSYAPFIGGLRSLQERLEMLKSIKIDPTTVRVATIDQYALPPISHIKPKRKLIVVFGIVLGFIIGVIASIILNFIENKDDKG